MVLDKPIMTTSEGKDIWTSQITLYHASFSLEGSNFSPPIVNSIEKSHTNKVFAFL